MARTCALRAPSAGALGSSSVAMPQTMSTIATTSASFNAAPRCFMILLGGLRLRPLADLSGRPCLVAWLPRRVGGVPPVLGCPFLVVGPPAGHDRLTASGGKADETHRKLGSRQDVDLCLAR